MANFHNHPRIRCRNYEYPRLIPSDIKRYLSLPNGSRHSLSWSKNGQLVLKLHAITTSYGLYLKSCKGFQQLILTTWTKLKNGSRQWWLCPECHNRCSLLYFDNGFACRHCIKPAYECQNGSRGDYLARKIRELRFKAWGNDIDNDDVLESIYTMPRPKNLSDSQYHFVCQRVTRYQLELCSSLCIHKN